MIKKLRPIWLLAFILAGCATSVVTNLTSTVQPRNDTGLYPVEMALDTTQQTLRLQSVTPYVLVGFDTYKMRPTLKMANRWEALVPVPANKDALSYHFKIDYEYNKFGKPGQGSMLSSEYKLTIK
jgi:hypothetical protein